MENAAACSSVCRLSRGVRARSDRAQDVVVRAVEIDPLHARSRRHDRSDRAIGEIQDSLDHVPLDVVDHAQPGPLGNEEMDVLLRHGLLGSRPHPQQPQEQASGRLSSQTTGAAAFATEESGSATRIAIGSGLLGDQLGMARRWVVHDIGGMVIFVQIASGALVLFLGTQVKHI